MLGTKWERRYAVLLRFCCSFALWIMPLSHSSHRTFSHPRARGHPKHTALWQVHRGAGQGLVMGASEGQVKALPMRTGVALGRSK